ncbi:diguanylate cyclase domain-containing protein [Anaeromusa acidaminophila]|uniref:diguanylate cyclase domain-containing protein n=1 Tax=Anaeromusa acidaminophila TaxID=81464 RepID=UPI000371F95A|nr:diguanylate cyclase [Anaeromusa acidaminophila]
MSFSSHNSHINGSSTSEIPLLYRQLLHAAPASALVLTKNRLWVNRNLQEQLHAYGLPQNRSHLWQLVCPQDRRPLLRILATAFQSPGTPLYCELRLELRPQELSFFETTVVRPEDSDSLCLFLLNLTEERRLQERLAHREKQWKLISTTSEDGFWEWDLQLQQGYLSRRGQTLLGYAPEELSIDLDAVQHYIHPADQSHFYQQLAEHLTNRRPYFHCDYRMLAKNGTWRWVRSRGLVFRSELGQPLHILGTIRDIHENRLAEERLLLRNRLLADLHEVALGLLKPHAQHELLDVILDKATAFMGVSDSLLVIDEQGSGLTAPTFMATRGKLQFLEGQASSEACGLTQLILQSQYAICIENYATWPRRHPALSVLGAALAVPLRLGERTMGAFLFFASASSQQFSPEEIQAAKHLADLAVASIRNTSLAASLARETQERNQAESELQESQSRYEQLLALLPDAVFQVDRDTKIIIDANEQFAQLLGYTRQEVLYKPILSFIDTTVHPTSEMEHLYATIPDDGPIPRETKVYLHKDGSQVYLERSGSTSRSQDRCIILFVARDVSAQLAKEERLRYLGFHDALTGLGNRACLEDILAKMKTAPSPFALGILLCDLDRLKKTNDSLGHAAGDLAIMEAASILRRCFRQDDVIIRFGGDEFLVVLPHVSLDLVSQKCQNLLTEAKKVSQRWNYGYFGLSVGWAYDEKGSLHPQQLIQQADQQMYANKRRDTEPH